MRVRCAIAAIPTEHGCPLLAATDGCKAECAIVLGAADNCPGFHVPSTVKLRGTKLLTSSIQPLTREVWVIPHRIDVIYLIDAAIIAEKDCFVRGPVELRMSHDVVMIGVSRRRLHQVLMSLRVLPPSCFSTDRPPTITEIRIRRVALE